MEELQCLVLGACSGPSGYPYLEVPQTVPCRSQGNQQS